MKNKKRPLRPDKLGGEGEKKYRNFDGDLIVNKSSEDLVGWDFTIDLPNEYISKAKFPDLADDPLSARVQVKTIWDDNNSISAPLPAMQRLAIFNGPAFLVTIKINHKIEVVSVHVLHIFDEALSKILKRLTKVENSKNFAKKTISFTIDKSWHQLDISDRTAQQEHYLAELSKFDSAAKYSEQKEIQRLTSGVSHRTLKFSTVGVSQLNVENALLGIKPIPIENAGIFETRYGKERKIESFPAGTTILAVPDENSGERCIVKTRSKSSISPTVLNGRLLAPPLPHVDQEHTQYRFLFGAFSLLFSRGSNPEIKQLIKKDEEQSLENWERQIAFINERATGETNISISSPHFNFEFTSPISSSPNELNQWFASIGEALGHLQTVCRRLSITQLHFSLDQFLKWNGDISQFYYMSLEPDKAIRYEVSFHNQQNFDGNKRIGLIRRLRFSNFDFVYVLAVNAVCQQLSNHRTRFYYNELLGFDFCNFGEYRGQSDHDHWENEFQIDEFILDTESGLTLPHSPSRINPSDPNED